MASSPPTSPSLPPKQLSPPPAPELNQAADSPSLSVPDPDPDPDPSSIPDGSSAKQSTSKIAALEANIARLQAELATNQAREADIRRSLKSPSSPSSTVQSHISLLHAYNQIRDIGTGLMALIAESRGLRLRDVYREFGIEEGEGE